MRDTKVKQSQKRPRDTEMVSVSKNYGVNILSVHLKITDVLGFSPRTRNRKCAFIFSATILVISVFIEFCQLANLHATMRDSSWKDKFFTVSFFSEQLYSTKFERFISGPCSAHRHFNFACRGFGLSACHHSYPAGFLL